jgi:predicted dehydrogenase
MRSILLGAGGFGRDVVPALIANGIEIAVLVDPDRDALEDTVRSYGLKPSLVLDSDERDWCVADAELVVDCTPPAYHAQHAEIALAAGKDLLVAKPMALTLADARQMTELAAAHGRRLAAIQQMRYLPPFLAVRELVQDGRLGRLGLVTINFNVDGTFWKPGLAWRLAMEHPVLLEGSVHVLDLVRWVTGDEPVGVVAHTFSPPWSEFRGFTGLTVSADLAGGAVVRYMANWAPRGSAIVPLNSGWELEFDHGLVRIADEGVSVNGEQLLAPRTPEMPLAELNTRLVQWYVGDRDGSAVSGPTGADNVRTMAFVEAVRRSATDGVRVALP